MTVMLKCTTRFTGPSGSPGYTVLYWRPGTGGGSTADATDIAARVRANWGFLFSRFQTGTAIQVDGTMDAIEDTTGAIVGAFTGTTPAVLNANGTGGQVPAASALLVQARTSNVVNGRFLRGRTFVSYLTVGQLGTDGSVASATATAFNSGFNGMLTGGGTASFPVVWHRPGTGVGISYPVTSYTTWSLMATLRSRRD